MTDIPDFTTPDEFAAHFGWSPRRVRSLARELGACRLVGNKMVLLKEDVDRLLEATKRLPSLEPPQALSPSNISMKLRLKKLMSASGAPQSTRDKLS
ncbi:MAG: hypothetical protein BGO05_16000 [Rhizobiales bacterium 63-7]|nr:hypothetical protein [Hyphomicrobiales bacterium]OJU69542.1 MAG: hypothetical protein BGO05_16000 [Rhizobiales bacterium 63-7]